MSNSKNDGRGDKGGADSSEGGSGFKGRRVTTCSFCGKSSREVGPMVEGPNDVYICANCTELCQNIFKQERRRVHAGRPTFGSIPTPRHLKEFVDQYVIGQEQAKRTREHNASVGEPAERPNDEGHRDPGDNFDGQKPH